MADRTPPTPAAFCTPHQFFGRFNEDKQDRMLEGILTHPYIPERLIPLKLGAMQRDLGLVRNAGAHAEPGCKHQDREA
jgi:hypothetical protein